jgi:hypothetical protein
VNLQLGAKTHRSGTLHLPRQSARPRRNALLSNDHVGPGALSPDCVRSHYRRSMPEVRSYLPPAAWDVSLHHAARQGQGNSEKLAAAGRSLHLRHRRRPHPRPRRPRRKRRGHPHRQAAALYRLRWSASAVLLPMYLDAGTNNEQYLHDPLYLGMRKTRPCRRGSLFLCRRVRRSSAGSVPEVLHSLRRLDRQGRCAPAPALSRQVLRLQRRRARYGRHHPSRDDQRGQGQGHKTQR